jgi:Skp family chaperone for outer membrane proteins
MIGKGVLAAAALTLVLAGAGLAQQAQAPSILVVDLEAAMRQSATAGALRDIEVRERRALQARFDEEKAMLEAREAELVDLRAKMDKAQFDKLTAEFDARVRRIRRAAQEDAAALQARFAGAQRELYQALRPMAEALMRERGAVVILDRKGAAAFDPSLDVTDALAQRLNAAAPDAEALLAAQPTPPPRTEPGAAP